MKGQTSSGDKNIWIKTQRVLPNVLYKNDSLQQIKNVGAKKKSILRMQGSITLEI